VRVVAGDAGAGSLDEEPFDRVIFTAGSYDIPAWLHARVRVGGLLLLSLKLPGGGDFVTLFRREEGCFVALTARACEVVWMTGQTHDSSLDPCGSTTIPNGSASATGRRGSGAFRPEVAPAPGSRSAPSRCAVF